MALSSLTLQQLVAVYRISEDCISLYEREGLVSPWLVGEDKHYTAKDRIRIEVILKGKKLGFSLREIKSLIEVHLPTPGPQAVDHDRLRSQITQLENEKAALQAAIERLRTKSETEED